MVKIHYSPRYCKQRRILTTGKQSGTVQEKWHVIKKPALDDPILRWAGRGINDS